MTNLSGNLDDGQLGSSAWSVASAAWLQRTSRSVLLWDHNVVSCSVMRQRRMSSYRTCSVSGLVRPVYIAAETLECAPSESTNWASILPYSCLVGGMLNVTPFALIS